MSEQPSGDSPKFAVFRARDAKSYAEASVMQQGEVSAVIAAGAQKVTAAGVEEGHDVKLLFEMPGFSLSYAWFKSGFPLPRHSHNVDCLYYVVGGSLRIGTEELGVGDGFFVGSDVPYTYAPGPAGVEVLEFRAANAFDIKVLANNPAYWERAAKAVEGLRGDWAGEKRPSMMDFQRPH